MTGHQAHHNPNWRTIDEERSVRLSAIPHGIYTQYAVHFVAADGSLYWGNYFISKVDALDNYAQRVAERTHR